MQCKTCDYPLWGLAARVCPECGSGFRPGEFTFVPNTVQFCCPHCRQSYYGTSEQGHLAPDAFECVTCGRPISMDEMVLFPAEGLAEEATRARQMPWLERRERGFVRSWFATFWMGMIRPARLIALTPVQSSTWSALAFAWIAQTLFCVSWLIAAPFVLALMLASGSGGNWVTPVLAILAGVFLAMVLGAVLGIVLWGLLAHLVLRCTGQTESGLARTLQAICYSSGANVFMGVPCVGVYLSPIGAIWWAISSILMLRAGQGVGSIRASLAVGAPPLGAVCLIVGLSWLGERAGPSFPVASRPAPVAVPISPERAEEVEKVGAALAAYREANNGAYPRHALGLVTAKLPPKSFVSAMSEIGTDLSAIRIGPMTLDEFALLSPGQQAGVVEALSGAMPKDVIVHRLGDFVFTYHGIEPDSMDPGLWTHVLAPRPPSENPVPDPEPFIDSTFMLDGVVAGRVDGATEQISTRNLTARLEAQNRLRSRYGLAPLPDLSGVTARRPAVGDWSAGVAESAPEPGG